MAKHSQWQPLLSFTLHLDLLVTYQDTVTYYNTVICGMQTTVTVTRQCYPLGVS